jgi:hypothetical protein
MSRTSCAAGWRQARSAQDHEKPAGRLFEEMAFLDQLCEWGARAEFP